MTLDGISCVRAEYNSRVKRLVPLLLSALGALNACAETIHIGPTRAPMDIPRGYMQVFRSPDGALTVLQRAAASPGDLPDELAVFFESLPATGSPKADWKAGHEFTWGNESSWGFTDSRVRIYEGVRLIEGREETRFAALFPSNDVAIGIAFRGELAARGRLGEDLLRIATSLGARSSTGSFSGGLRCGGIRGGYSVMKLFRDFWPVAAVGLFVTALCLIGRWLDRARPVTR